MNHTRIARLALGAAFLLFVSTNSQGQGSAFTYQGMLQAAGQPANGGYDFMFRLMDTPSGGTAAPVVPVKPAVLVTNGLFTTEIDFGADALSGANQWLEISVRPAGSQDDFTTLNPRQQLTPTPYAVNALSATDVTSGTVENPVFIGTTISDPFDISVNGNRALRMVDNGDGSDGDELPDGAPNIIAGSSVNIVSGTVVGATISGGGATDFGGFQFSNSIKSDYSVIGGGLGNLVETNSTRSVIGGGINNWILANSQESVVGGGGFNLISEYSIGSAIAGGSYHRLESFSPHSTIGGGAYNTIDAENTGSTIGGGLTIRISAGNRGSTVSGGESNGIGEDADWSTIGGGSGNFIGTSSVYSQIGGGIGNSVGTNSYYSTIGGGLNNNVGDNSERAVIGGGAVNSIPIDSPYATIPGGLWNTATNFAFAAGLQAKALHTGSFVWGDSTYLDIASQNSNSVTFRASGGYRLFTDGTATAGVSLAPGATAWSVISDRSVKKDFSELDRRDVLEKLAALPIQSWHYNWESADDTPHIGPVAQDFKAAFYPGRDDTTINTLEFDGVALAAIQGLNQKLEEKSLEIEALKKQNLDLLDRLQAIETKLE